MNLLDQLKPQKRQKNNDCSKCHQSDSMIEIGPGLQSCLTCGFVIEQQQFQNDFYKDHSKKQSQQIRGPQSFAFSNQHLASVKYNSEEKTKFQREMKLKAWVKKLSVLNQSEQDLVFKIALEYITSLQSHYTKSEPYNVVVAGCVYLLKKQKKVKDNIDIKKSIELLGKGSASTMKPKHILKVADNIKTQIKWLDSKEQIQQNDNRKMQELIRSIVKKLFTKIKDRIELAMQSSDAKETQLLLLDLIPTQKRETLAFDFAFQELPTYHIESSVLSGNSLTQKVSTSNQIQEVKSHIETRMKNLVTQINQMESSVIIQAEDLTRKMKEQFELNAESTMINQTLIMGIVTYTLLEDYLDIPNINSNNERYKLTATRYTDVIKLKQNEIAEYLEVNPSTLNKSYRKISDITKSMLKLDQNIQELNLINYS